MDILGSSIQIMVPVSLITLSGLFLTRQGYFTKDSNKVTAMVTAKFLLPVLYTVSLSRSITLSKLAELWPLLISPILYLIIVLLIGLVFVKTCKPPDFIKMTLVCMISFSGLGNVAVILINGACSSFGPLDGQSDCEDAQAYIFLQALTYNTLYWGVGYSLIQFDYKLEQRDLDEGQIIVQQIKAYDKKQIAKNILKNLVQPIPLATDIGILLGIIPWTKLVFFNQGAPLGMVGETLYIMGYSGLILNISLLGSTLYHHWKDKINLKMWQFFGVVLIRTVVVPVFGLFYLALMFEVNFFGQNKVMAYAAYQLFVVPTSVVNFIMLQIANLDANETSKIMVWIYIVSAFTVAAFTYLFFLIF